MFIRVSALFLFVLMRLTTFSYGHLVKMGEQHRSSETDASSEHMPEKSLKTSTTSQYPGQLFPTTPLRNNLSTNPFSVLQTTVPNPQMNSSKTTSKYRLYCSHSQLFYKDTCTERPTKAFPIRTSNTPIEPSKEEIPYPDDRFSINKNFSEDLEEMHVFDYYRNVFRRVTCLDGFQYKDGYCVYADINSTLNVKATIIINRDPLTGRRKEYSRKSLFRIAQLLYKTFFVFKLSRILQIDIYQNVFNSSELKRSQSRMEYRFRFGSDNLDKGRFTRVKHFWISSRNMGTDLVYPFSKILFCPMIRLGKNETFINNISQLCLREFNVCFDSIQYYISEYIQVCKDDYLSLLDSTKLVKAVLPPYNYRPEGYLSLAISCLSAFCLLITLAIYTICPELRTLSGKCNMFLCLSLMIAQIIFGFGMPLNEFPLLCKILGFFIHYFWLVSFFWMSACSVQMFLLFGRLNINNMISNSKRLLKYCLYAYGTPILLTGTNIVYSTLSSKGENFGYGLDVCYITYPIMILVTFAVPVFLIIFSNILTFVVVCCRINHHQKIDAVQKRYSRSKVLAKLSFLIGSPWIIAFVNYWIRDKILEYIFLALSGSQGLFIMISFVCTRRVNDIFSSMLAYQAVKQNGVPVYRAAKEYVVLLTTLRDCVDNRVDIDCIKTGPEPLLSQFEEAKLVNHLKELASVRYGYTRAEVLEFKPPNIVAGRGYHPQADMPEKSKTITVIGAEYALGNQIPPYFVFPGQRMMPELMKGKSVGAD
ncbi:uncharacterized protein LOC134282954 [Saccostrea cucullata]|uniref:uncharacterized protein LOC134282954 n=1 Tax=Saccostrea cuccullata TaxID=36930 RepID=UPI002ED3EE17